MLGAIYVLFLLPDALLRFVLWCVTNTIYRIRVVGRDNIPAKGGALFVCNHLSFADALLVIASTDRPIRFLMFKGIYEQRWVKPFAKILRVIPVSSEQRPRELIHSLQAASDAIRNGEVVCIFAEGQITRIGQLLPFHRGFERIMKNVDAPIIPIALDGVIGSPTSFEHGRMVRRFPEHLPHPVTVSFGTPLPPNAPPGRSPRSRAESHCRCVAVPPRPHGTDAAQFRPYRAPSSAPVLHDRCDQRENQFWHRAGENHFSRAPFEKSLGGQEMVGFFLPPSVPGALVNHAAFLCGKVPVNLNYTLSEATIAACARQCDIKTVITSRKFLEKIKLTPPGELIYLEDITAGVQRHGEKITAFLLAKFAPFSLLKKIAGQEKEVALDDLATVIFSSGSTGEPKGVMLSHYNILSNLEQIQSHPELHAPTTVFLASCRFFILSGSPSRLCLPAAIGAGVVFHPNPLDARPLARSSAKMPSRILLATPTFLQLYMRGVPSEDFGGLQLVITGAEKLPERLADAFEQYFGIRPLEGYGTTECAPGGLRSTSWIFARPAFIRSAASAGKSACFARHDGAAGRSGKSVERKNNFRRRAGHVARARTEYDARLSRPAGKNGRRAAARLVLHRRRGDH